MNTIALSKQPAAWPSVLIKVAMAVSGAGMAVWLTLHMLGNLLWVLGPELMNDYGHKLHESGVLWPVRAVVFAGLVVHVLGAVLTTQRAQQARPIAYRKAKPTKRWATFASRSMRWTGFVLLAFLGYHVASAYGAGHPGFLPGEFHHNLSGLLTSPLHALLLTAATIFVTIHLAHGLTSAWITLGAPSPRGQALIRKGFKLWTTAMTIGFSAPLVTAWTLQLLG